ncbi:ABC transporter ATP-binding protein/permease [Eubacteriales bacterium OttesenSCG-928-G02]|nr:ABC transporter ATP-binding protein/permease [Eubacteriales bacterium OttesenSCG-928-G02]
MIKLFFSYYKPHRKLFIIDMVCAFVLALCDLFYPEIARNIINDFVPNKQLNFIIIWSVILLGIYILKMILQYILQYWGHIVGTRIQGDMRRDMFRHMQKLPFSFFDENKTGTIMSRIINDLMDVSELAHHGPEDLFLSVIMLIGSFFMLVSINFYLTLIVYAFIPLMVFFAVRNRKRLNRAFTDTRIKVAEINSSVESSISGMRVSRAYTAADYENSRFDVSNSEFIKARGLAYKEMGIFYSGLGFFSDLLYLVILVAGGLFFYYGKINSGDFAAFLLYITMFLKPINRLVSLFEQIQNGITGFNRFKEIIDTPAETEGDDIIDIKALNGNIVFKNVSFKYSDEDEVKYVLTNLDLNIPQGKTIALVGPSGGGKTTICHLIPRFYELTDGIIYIDGIDITQMKRESLRKNIGIVAQDVFLFNGTIKENILYGRLDATDIEVEEAAKNANIHEYIMSLPDGYQTQVGERGIKLSGGQKQRVSIARVFLKNPPILILDEATSALDNVTESLIQDSLSNLAKNRTCIVVAHRLSTIKNADEIVVISDEGIKERGTHEKLLADDSLYAALYKYQFKDLV